MHCLKSESEILCNKCLIESKKRPNANWNIQSLTWCCFQVLSCSSVLQFRAELGFCLHFHDVAPFVQLNNKLLITSLRRGLRTLFTSTRKTVRCLWELKLWILKSLSISCVRCCLYDLIFFFWRHKLDLAVEPRCRSLKGEKRSGASSAFQRGRGELAPPDRDPHW